MQRPSNPSRNVVVALSLVAVAGGMVGLSYAAAPLYRIFCEVTGYGGTPQRADANRSEMLGREIVVRLDANISSLPWDFRPEVQQVHARLGETMVVDFLAENTGPTATSGTATFNVQPDIAGVYFNKIECFCFTEQKLQPGESARLPVQFFLSPDLADDPELDGIRTITLSYTFFPVAEEGQPVARADGDGAEEKL